MTLISLTLVEHVHVSLANSDFALVLLKTAQKVLVVVHARVLLLLLLLLVHAVVVLLIGSTALHLLLLLLAALLRSFATTATAAAHHASHNRVRDSRTGSEGHACSHGAHEATAHTSHAALSWGGLLRCLSRGRGPRRRTGWC